MKSTNALSLDLTGIDEYLLSVRLRLELPINQKLQEYEGRRGTMVQLTEVADLLKDDQTVQELTLKMAELDEAVEMLRHIWDSQSGSPSSPPTSDSALELVVLDASTDEVVSEEDTQEESTEPVAVAETTEASEEANGEDTESHVAAESSTDQVDTNRIAEEALRDSRRRGYTGSGAVKASPNGIPSRNYEVVRANNPLNGEVNTFGATGQVRNVPGIY